MDLFRGYAKLLYLDCDVLVCGDIGELLAIDLGNFHLGAVREMDLGARKDLGTAIGLAEPWEYFNSGVLLMNLEVIRREGLAARWKEILSDGSIRLSLCDQDAVNITSSGNYYHLDTIWNCAAFRKNHVSTDGHRIVHFMGPKPWNAPWDTIAKLRRDYWKFVKELRCPFLLRKMRMNRRKSRPKELVKVPEQILRCLRNLLFRAFGVRWRGSGRWLRWRNALCSRLHLR
jgi:lipopolysaccharide biosynthesis glycosyltransferase